MPVKVLGFTGLPNERRTAGDGFRARSQTVSEERLESKRAGKLATPQRAALKHCWKRPMQKGLRIVLKRTCKVREALTGALNQVESKEGRPRNNPRWSRPISENDILPASASTPSSASIVSGKHGGNRGQTRRCRSNFTRSFTSY